MADWSDPTNFQLEALLEALLFAYRTPLAFRTFLNLKLGKNYAEYAPADAAYRDALYGVLDTARGDGWLKCVVAAALWDKPRSPKLRLLNEVADLSRVPDHPLEAIVRHEGQFQDLYPWIERLAGIAPSICRVENPINQAAGTGWLVAADLVLTNWHVVRDVIETPANAPNLAFRFDYATDAGRIQPGLVCQAADDCIVAQSPPGENERGQGQNEPSPDELDFALVRLRAPPGDGPRGSRTPIRVKRNANLPRGGIMMVLQHPSGAPVKLAIGAERGSNAARNRLYHDANTQPGSSGSPCLNAKLEVVALHHAGDGLYGGAIGSPNQNQAVPIGIIAQCLETKANVRL
jgi:Trypsin-like peptidase domain/Effector-associated domain 1